MLEEGRKNCKKLRMDFGALFNQEEEQSPRLIREFLPNQIKTAPQSGPCRWPLEKMRTFRWSSHFRFLSLWVR